MIHLQGMGVFGSFLGLQLQAMGSAFTWSDTNSSVTAWRACTGIVYPSGDPFDTENYERWKTWANAPGIREHVETCPYWYSSKNPPHGFRGKAVRDLGPLRLSPAPSFHLNAQTFVPETRERFTRQRTAGPAAGDIRIVAHGFDPRRLHHVLWGWTVPVTLKLSAHLGSERPAIYCRQGRFVMAYAYPRPGSRSWYSGSSLIVQKVPKELSVWPKFDRWKNQLAVLTDGLVTASAVGPAITGWRPAAAPSDTALAVIRDGETLTRPLWSSGVRHAPLVVKSVLEVAGLA